MRLLACSTGKIESKGSCIAQDLADRLGVTVSAPNDTLYVGRHRSGSMVEFTPRGDRR